MRIAISVDMEGISGTVSFKQIVAGNPEFERAQRLATADVNAAVAGAREAGATRFFLHDTHWLDEINVLLDELDESVEYVGGQPLLLWEDLPAPAAPRGPGSTGYTCPTVPDPAPVSGIGTGAGDAAFLIGYHAHAGLPGIMSHVFTDLIRDVRLNGRSVGEGVLAAALAGYYDIPTILVTGDDQVCAEMKEWCPGIQTAQTKASITRYAARCLPLKEARANIREAARRAVGALRDRKASPYDHPPLRVPPPISLEVDWRNNQTARSVALMPGVEQVGLETTRFSHDDFAQVDRVLKAMLHIALSPLNAGHVQMP